MKQNNLIKRRFMFRYSKKSSSSAFVCPDQYDGLWLKGVIFPDTEYLVRWKHYQSFANDVRHRLGPATTTPDQELRRNDHRLPERAGGAAKPCSALLGWDYHRRE